MNTHNLLHSHKLSNGLTVSIYDRTKVYFGDYHHVRLKVVCVQNESTVDHALGPLDDACHSPVLYTRTLEKMGVSSHDIPCVIRTLLVDFEHNSLPYIAAADFPKKMIKHTLSRSQLSSRKYCKAGF